VLNCDKTEGIWIGSKAAINKLKPEDRSLTVNNDTTCRTWTRCSFWYRVVDEAAHCESRDRLLLPYPSSTSNTSSRRTGGQRASCADYDYVTSWLLQLGASGSVPALSTLEPLH